MNDNRVMTQAEDDLEVAAIATRCLDMLRAPDRRMKDWRLAWSRWGVVQAAAGEVFGNEQATVEQTVLAIQVIASWQRYWFKFHPKRREQERACDAWLRTCALLELHERRKHGNFVGSEGSAFDGTDWGPSACSWVERG